GVLLVCLSSLVLVECYWMVKKRLISDERQIKPGSGVPALHASCCSHLATSFALLNKTPGLCHRRMRLKGKPAVPMKIGYDRASPRLARDSVVCAMLKNPTSLCRAENLAI